MRGHVVSNFLSILVQGSNSAQMPGNVPAVVQRTHAYRRRLKTRLSTVLFKFSKDGFVAHSHTLLGNFPFSSMGNFPFEFGEP